MMHKESNDLSWCLFIHWIIFSFTCAEYKKSFSSLETEKLLCVRVGSWFQEEWIKILVDPEIKSMLLQEATSALSPEKLKVSEGETLKATAEYFYINLIFLLILFPKTLYDQYDRPGIDKYLFMLRVCFWRLACSLSVSAFPGSGVYSPDGRLIQPWPFCTPITNA